MPSIQRAQVDQSKFNRSHPMAWGLRLKDFEMAMEDVYDFFLDVNSNLLSKGLRRLDELIRPAALSGMLSDMLTDSLANHSRGLVPNVFHNGHPDLIVRDRYPGNSVQSGTDGVEIKTTRKRGGAADSHGARDQTLCTFVYEVDNDPSKPAHLREPLKIREVYLADVTVADYRKNARGELGTRTATLDAAGIAKYRLGWVYLDLPTSATGRIAKTATWRQAQP